MIKQIVKDTFFLQQKSVEATKEDIYIGQDLLETLLVHKEQCVGLAANMIGYHKRIIVIQTDFFPLVMFNPILTSCETEYVTEEGCLSLTGARKTKRYKKISLTFRDKHWKKQNIVLTDFVAQICQHELEHLEGILI